MARRCYFDIPTRGVLEAEEEGGEAEEGEEAHYVRHGREYDHRRLGGVESDGLKADRDHGPGEPGDDQVDYHGEPDDYPECWAPLPYPRHRPRDDSYKNAV